MLKKKLTTDFDIKTEQQKTDAMKNFSILQMATVEKFIMDNEYQKEMNRGLNPKTAQIANRGFIPQQNRFGIPQNLSTRQAFSSLNPNTHLSTMNNITSMLGSKTVNNDTYARVYRDAETLGLIIDDIINNQKHLIPELKSDFNQWLNLINGKTSNYQFLDNFINEYKRKLDNTAYIKPVSQLEKEEQKEFRDNIKLMAEEARIKKQATNEASPTQSSENSTYTDYSALLTDMNNIKSANIRNLLTELVKNIYDRKVDIKDINFPEIINNGYRTLLKSYIKILEHVKDSNMPQDRKNAIYAKVDVACINMFNTKKNFDDIDKENNDTIMNLLGQLSHRRINPTHDEDEEAIIRETTEVIRMSLQTPLPEAKTKQQKSVLADVTNMMKTVLSGSANAIDASVQGIGKVNKKLSELVESMQNMTVIYVNIEEMRKEKREDIMDIVNSFLKTHFTNLSANEVSVVSNTIMGIITEPNKMDLIEYNDILEEYNLRVAPSDGDLISLDDDRFQKLPDSEDENEYFYLYLKPDFNLGRQVHFKELFDSHNITLNSNAKQNKADINDVYNELNKYKVANSEEKKRILKYIFAEYNIVVKFDDNVDKGEFRGSGLEFPAISTILGYAKALLTGGSNGTTQFVQRRTNGYDTLSESMNIIKNMIEKGGQDDLAYRIRQNTEINNLKKADPSYTQYISYDLYGDTIFFAKVVVVSCCLVYALKLLVESGRMDTIEEIRRRLFNTEVQLANTQQKLTEQTENMNRTVERLAEATHHNAQAIGYMGNDLYGNRRWNQNRIRDRNDNYNYNNNDDDDDDDNAPRRITGTERKMIMAPPPKRSNTSKRSSSAGRGRGKGNRGRGVGGNIINDIAEKYIDITYMPNTIHALAQYGDYQIVRSAVSRAIIMPRFLNTINKYIRVVPYDDLYHLKLILVVRDHTGRTTTLQMEKVPHIVLRPYKETPGEEHMDIDLEGFTVNELLKRARSRVGDKTFFTYNAFKENCQHFVALILETAGVYDVELRNFIYQQFDLSKINSMYIKGAKTITDLKKIFDRIFTGGEIDLKK